jgi:hypothetical protein
MPVFNFDEAMAELRKQLKALGKQVLYCKEEKTKEETDGVENISEVMANLMLSYRHIEDASMRIGKVLQARNGGVSTYDKDVVGSPE